MEKFNLNEHGVFTNPNSYTIFQNSNCYLIIETAKLDNKWSSGFQYLFKSPSFSGGGGLPTLKSLNFNTEKEAFDSELEHLKMRVKNEGSKYHFILKILDEIENKFFPKEVQLSLF